MWKFMKITPQVQINFIKVCGPNKVTIDLIDFSRSDQLESNQLEPDYKLTKSRYAN